VVGVTVPPGPPGCRHHRAQASTRYFYGEKDHGARRGEQQGSAFRSAHICSGTPQDSSWRTRVTVPVPFSTISAARSSSIRYDTLNLAPPVQQTLEGLIPVVSLS
jgi:hypothetical protein